jgi:hypothetical protein
VTTPLVIGGPERYLILLASPERSAYSLMRQRTTENLCFRRIAIRCLVVLRCVAMLRIDLGSFARGLQGPEYGALAPVWEQADRAKNCHSVPAKKKRAAKSPLVR